MKDKINFTIDEELMRRIRQLAEAENRNLSNMVETLLTEAMEARQPSE